MVPMECGNSLLNHGFVEGVFSMNGGWDYIGYSTQINELILLMMLLLLMMTMRVRVMVTTTRRMRTMT